MFSNTEEALKHLTPLIGLSPGKLAELPAEQLKRAWQAIFYVFPGLHPDETEHKDIVRNAKICRGQPYDSIATPYYASSGWPARLVPIQKEIWRRNANQLIDELDVYPTDAQAAGIRNAQNN